MCGRILKKKQSITEQLQKKKRKKNGYYLKISRYMTSFTKSKISLEHNGLQWSKLSQKSLNVCMFVCLYDDSSHPNTDTLQYSDDTSKWCTQLLFIFWYTNLIFPSNPIFEWITFFPQGDSMQSNIFLYTTIYYSLRIYINSQKYSSSCFCQLVLFFSKLSKLI